MMVWPGARSGFNGRFRHRYACFARFQDVGTNGRVAAVWRLSVKDEGVVLNVVGNGRSRLT